MKNNANYLNLLKVNEKSEESRREAGYVPKVESASDYRSRMLPLLRSSMESMVGHLAVKSTGRITVAIQEVLMSGVTMGIIENYQIHSISSNRDSVLVEYEIMFEGEHPPINLTIRFET